MRDDNRLDAIETLWAAGQRDKALAALGSHLAKDPEDATAWSLKGLYLLELEPNDPSLALVALERSLAISPTYQAAYNAGNALLDLDRLSEAQKLYELSIECFDGYPQAWVNKGIVQHRTAQTKDALVSFERALQLDAAFAPALRCKAIALEAVGDKEASEATYARLVELYPDDLDALSDYGRALSRLPPDNRMELHPGGREWRAVETLNVVIDRKPDDVAALLAKAEVLYRCMYANVCFRTNVVDYVPGPLRTGGFASELRSVLELAKQRFPGHPRFKKYEAALDELRSQN
ncbi:MAG TPA: tetratricopeptide repeat protein [Polyangiaceae bacterium]|jgi:tetratricopeptide (TPR) repeat protein|nr:tetratricopeptide repeat protein [Polyangiaceae bacterium]